jgi:hypothetical protein
MIQQIIMTLASLIFITLLSCATTPEERSCNNECERNNRECSDSCRGGYMNYVPSDLPSNMRDQRTDSFSSSRAYDCMSQCDKQSRNCRDRCSKPIKLNTQP